MSSLVTQCPKCKTAFRVSDAQLAAARGAVRCGACLTVFVATKHTLEMPETRPEPPAPSSAPRDGSPTFTIIAGGDDDALPEEELEAALQEIGGSMRAPQPTARPQPRPTPQWDDEEDEDEAPDLAHWRRPGTPQSANGDTPHWARALVEEISRERPTLRQPDPEPLHADPEDDPWPEEHVHLSHQAQQHHASRHFGARTAPPPVHEEPSLSNMDFRELMRASMDEQDEDLIGSEPIALDEPAPRRRTSPPERWTEEGQPSGALATIGWALACLVLVLTAGAQVIWFQFDHLVRQAQWRPYFELACPVLGCKVPPPYDIKLIQSSNLVVRSHPTTLGALIVDVDLVNNANIPQPFPLMHLRFSDMNNRVVAERVFKPAEYLGGELVGATLMPSHRPVKITLDIRDPGPTATDYTLQLFQQD